MDGPEKGVWELAFIRGLACLGFDGIKVTFIPI